MPSVRFCNKDSAEVRDIQLTSDNSNAPSSSFQHSSSGAPPSSSAAPSNFSVPRVISLGNPSSSTTQSMNYHHTDGADNDPVVSYQQKPELTIRIPHSHLTLVPLLLNLVCRV